MYTRRLLAIACLLGNCLSGCSRSGIELKPPSEKDEPIKLLIPRGATLYLGDDRKSVKVKYHNGTRKPIILDRQRIKSGVQALEVFDQNGLVTAPVSQAPMTETDELVIDSYRVHEVTYALDYFDPPLSPGTYRIHINPGTGFESNWLIYEVLAKQ
jgi:hypothetical protein